MIYKILTVIGLATFEIYAAIPAGFAFKLNPDTPLGLLILIKFVILLGNLVN